jgi:Ca-activated chloride channel family protein
MCGIAAALLFLGQAAFGDRVILDVSISNPYLLSNQRHRSFLKIGLTGFRLATDRERTPANVSIVLDRSGSMEGEKIEQAKEAAIMALDMLDERDIVSVVTYSDTVSVLVPATRVSNRRNIRRMIRSVYADGSTALFAGVSKGADEVRKFFDRNKVNRVILLSDGLANVGPDSPAALGDLGASLGRSGISVTTIGLGLGYNEDLMVKLAQKSDGNHAFVENSRDLARVFEYEFNDVLSVVAQDVEIEVRCHPGIHPIRVIGREADIIGNQVIASINQLYSEQQKYVLLEVEVMPQVDGTNLRAADVSVQYANTVSKSTDTLSANANVAFTQSKKKADESVDRETMEAAVLQVATEQSEKAVQLRDEGKIEEAKEVLENNAEYLRANAATLGSELLEDYGAINEADASKLESEEEWKASRKQMRDKQFENRSQQSY